jgi:hypothetical protein
MHSAQTGSLDGFEPGPAVEVAMPQRAPAGPVKALALRAALARLPRRALPWRGPPGARPATLLQRRYRSARLTRQGALGPGRRHVIGDQCVMGLLVLVRAHHPLWIVPGG